jgi:hypothetical protein
VLYRASLEGLTSIVCLDYCSLDVLKNKYLFLIVVNAGESEIKTMVDLVSGEVTLPNSQINKFWLHSYIVDSRKEASLLMFLIIRAIIPLCGIISDITTLQ